MNQFEVNKPDHFIELYKKELTFPIERLLEMGVQKGHSIKMWAKWLPNAEIVGLDIELNTVEIAEKNVKLVQGNQADLRLLETLGEFDVIIDDASHRTADQVKSFQFLIHKLHSGGLYFIEDVETNYSFDYWDGNGITFIEYAKALTDFCIRGNWFKRIVFLKDLIMIEKL